MTTDNTPMGDAADTDFDDTTSATLHTLEDVLDTIRERDPQVPQWEFCEGVMTAMLVMRRTVDEEEWLGAVFGREGGDVFASPAERTRFVMGWLAREAQLRHALDNPVEELDADGALTPAVTDWRGLLASLPEDERAEAADPDGPPPALARLWATGFIHAVDFWESDWAPPRDPEIAEMMADALQCIADLLEDDRDPPALNLYDEDSPPSVSEARFEAFGEALWAVYDLHDIAKSLGPRLPPVRNDNKVGRNDPCPCGSGKKYKKCHGA